jgi:hypothetical protein
MGKHQTLFVPEVAKFFYSRQCESGVLSKI